ncbi:hypothetical protein DUT91_17580 [Phyllobacterium salinisoli]|uniref:Uncharacterized protein n=1 Tax=Phyllobacterium salinisoli TaxID=1899321 RepID=A0A368K2R0_9HYPH|nr:hypothetical protein DUT91_17580 [Phyllobacterium salinisoli]
MKSVVQIVEKRAFIDADRLWLPLDDVLNCRSARCYASPMQSSIVASNAALGENSPCIMGSAEGGGLDFDP